MTATIRLPRMLADAANTEIRHQVGDGTVARSLADLFAAHPGIKNHVLDDRGEIRPHVSIFVDGHRAGLDTVVGEGSEVRVLNAVSGG
ncbi:MAG TPA: MoaD/ThiS family protein [Acidimicrobiia bacterium]|nr:MoaD/ThiS family protein [Acidimicrobiia bacterium]